MAALDRIGALLDRIDRATQRISAQVADQKARSEGDRAVLAALRAEVVATVADLDDVLKGPTHG